MHFYNKECKIVQKGKITLQPVRLTTILVSWLYTRWSSIACSHSCSTWKDFSNVLKLVKSNVIMSCSTSLAMHAPTKAQPIKVFWQYEILSVSICIAPWAVRTAKYLCFLESSGGFEWYHHSSNHDPLWWWWWWWWWWWCWETWLQSGQDSSDQSSHPGRQPTSLAWVNHHREYEDLIDDDDDDWWWPLWLWGSN